MKKVWGALGVSVILASTVSAADVTGRVVFVRKSDRPSSHGYVGLRVDANNVVLVDLLRSPMDTEESTRRAQSALAFAKASRYLKVTGATLVQTGFRSTVYSVGPVQGRKETGYCTQNHNSFPFSDGSASWNALNFAVDDPHYYSYEYSGMNSIRNRSVFVIAENGCEIAAFKRIGWLAGGSETSNGIQGGSGLYKSNPLE